MKNNNLNNIKFSYFRKSENDSYVIYEYLNNESTNPKIENEKKCFKIFLESNNINISYENIDILLHVDSPDFIIKCKNNNIYGIEIYQLCSKEVCEFNFFLKKYHNGQIKLEDIQEKYGKIDLKFQKNDNLGSTFLFDENKEFDHALYVIENHLFKTNNYQENIKLLLSKFLVLKNESIKLFHIADDSEVFLFNNVKNDSFIKSFVKKDLKILFKKYNFSIDDFKIVYTSKWNDSNGKEVIYIENLFNCLRN